MSTQDAINLVTQVCQNYKGTLQEHQLLQEALKIINQNISEPKKE